MQLQNLVGFILPPMIDLINSHVSDARLRYTISLIVCILVGILVNLDKLNSPSEIMGGIAVVFTSAQITYQTYWKRSEIRSKM